MGLMTSFATGSRSCSVTLRRRLARLPEVGDHLKGLGKERRPLNKVDHE